jgi:hypothetical protein
MSGLGLDTFLPAVPMGMSGLAEVMAALAESPEMAALGSADLCTTRARRETSAGHRQPGVKTEFIIEARS